MELNWILKEPIDFEHKEYVLLDYIQKTEERLDNFQLYPAFQELSLHFANTSKIRDSFEYITLKNPLDQPDQEILLSDIEYNVIDNLNNQEKQELKRIATYAYDKFAYLFVMAKSIWSLVYESVSLDLINEDENDLDYTFGFFRFKKDKMYYIYQYNVEVINDRPMENKFNIELIYVGKNKNYVEVVEETKTIDTHTIYSPFFDVNFSVKFPFEESVLPLVKRKVMNYVFQSTKIITHKKIKKS